MQLAGVACCGHGDKASHFIVRGQKPLTRTERERVSLVCLGPSGNQVSRFSLVTLSSIRKIVE